MSQERQVSRRQFLKLTGATAAAIALSPLGHDRLQSKDASNITAPLDIVSNLLTTNSEKIIDVPSYDVMYYDNDGRQGIHEGQRLSVEGANGVNRYERVDRMDIITTPDVTAITNKFAIIGQDIRNLDLNSENSTFSFTSSIKANDFLNDHDFIFSNITSLNSVKEWAGTLFDHSEIGTVSVVPVYNLFYTNEDHFVVNTGLQVQLGEALRLEYAPADSENPERFIVNKIVNEVAKGGHEIFSPTGAIVEIYNDQQWTPYLQTLKQNGHNLEDTLNTKLVAAQNL